MPLSACGCTPGAVFFATVGGMPDPDTDGSPVRPLAHRLAAHRFTPAQLVAIDLAAVLAVLAVFEFFMSPQPPRLAGPGWDTAGWITYLIAAAVTLLRRQLPRPVLAVVLLAAVAALLARREGPSVFYVVLALYSVVAVSSRRAALAIVAAVAAAILTAVIAGGGDQLVPSAIAGVALVLLAWLAGENTRASRVYASQQTERAAEKAAAAEAERSAQVRRALADERAEIARELHDIVAHAMSVIAVRSGVARMVIDTQPEQARDALAIIETTTRQSLQEMRLLVGVLRDSGDHSGELSPAPGLGDLGPLIAGTALAGVDVDLARDGTVRALPPAADLSAYRIVQEALTNVVRHAGPTRAQVRIRYRPDEVVIEVTDDGPQGPRPAAVPRAGSGHGLIGMRERAALFGGDLTAGPQAAGFGVRASLRTDGFPACAGVASADVAEVPAASGGSR
jgi:signal transduction histidine kinase